MAALKGDEKKATAKNSWLLMVQYQACQNFETVTVWELINKLHYCLKTILQTNDDKVGQVSRNDHTKDTESLQKDFLYVCKINIQLGHKTS